MMETYKKKVVLLGDSAVGKTSLIRKFVLNQYDDKYISTVGTKTSKRCVNIKLKNEIVEVALVIWDVIGAQGYHSTQAKHIAGADCAVLVSDLTRPETLKGLMEYWIPLLGVITAGVLPPIIFLSNKSDLYSKPALPAKEDIISTLMSSESCNKILTKNPITLSWYPTSAKSGENVEKAFATAAWLIFTKNLKKDVLMTEMDELIAETIFWTNEWSNLISLIDRLFVNFEKLVGPELGNALLQKAFQEEKVSNKNPTHDGIKRVIVSTTKMAMEHGITEKDAMRYQKNWLALLDTIK